jgi:hypothetical protein
VALLGGLLEVHHCLLNLFVPAVESPLGQVEPIDDAIVEEVAHSVESLSVLLLGTPLVVLIGLSYSNLCTLF